MPDDQDRLKHERSPYERPTRKFRCGREGLWGPPCGRGPTPEGACGGVTDCVPVKNKQGRFECRRVPDAGGPCPEGPRPDGSCSQTHPPCHPIATLRLLRGRFALAAAALIAALIGLLRVLPSFNVEGPSPLDPGPLTTAHANAVSSQGCLACHAPHDRPAAAWLGAAVTASATSSQCLRCHAFGGPETAAHNSRFANRADVRETTCVMCHSEHQGATFDLTRLSDAQCSTCHRVKVRSFATDHPAFPAYFPYEEPTAIAFDHTTHLNRYFKDPKFAPRAPQSCATCHVLDPVDQREVTTAAFKNCAGCHAADISHHDLMLFRLPLLEPPPDPTFVAAACEAPKTGGDSATESISEEDPTLLTGFMLGIDTKDPKAYSEPITRLLVAMAKEGTTPLAEALDTRLGAAASAELLSGLSPEVVRRAACAWAMNQEYAPMEGATGSGWRADELSLRYTPKSHADVIAKRWIELSLNAPTVAADASTQRHAAAMRAGVLTRARGVGACLKCHVVTTATTTEETQRLTPRWTSAGRPARPFTSFSHGVHVTLLGGVASCTTCHAIAQPGGATPEVAGSFQPITKERCAACHGDRASRTALGTAPQECLLCHSYHVRPDLTQTAESSLTSHRRAGIDEAGAHRRSTQSQQVEASLVASSGQAP